MDYSLSRREAIGAIGASTVALAGLSPARASTWPTRAINVIMPLQAGSASDVAVRIAGDAIGQRLKHNLVVENVTGAAGLIGATRAARAAPDGYTLAALNNSILTILPNVRAKKPDFDPFESFVPIVGVANIPTYLGVHKSLPVNNVQELIAYLKAKDGDVTCATGGVGSPQHFATEMFMAMTGVSVRQVPYRGAAAAATDLAGGHAQMMFIARSLYVPFEPSGAIRLIGFCGPKRSQDTPQLTTLDEQGVSGYDYSSWVGYFSVRGTAPAIIDRLRQEAGAALADPALQAKLVASGLENWFQDHEALAAVIREDDVRWRKVVKATNLSID